MKLIIVLLVFQINFFYSQKIVNSNNIIISLPFYEGIVVSKYDMPITEYIIGMLKNKSDSVLFRQMHFRKDSSLVIENHFTGLQTEISMKNNGVKVDNYLKGGGWIYYNNEFSPYNLIIIKKKYNKFGLVKVMRFRNALSGKKYKMVFSFIDQDLYKGYTITYMNRIVYESILIGSYTPKLPQ